MTSALKFFYLAGALIMTCVLLSVGLKVFYKMEAVSGTVMDDLTEKAARIEEGKLTVFDNSICQGYELINLLNREFAELPVGKKADMYIKVINGNKDIVHTGSEYLDDIRNYESDKYIKPLAEYCGKILRDKNDSIIGMEFTEMSY